MGEALLELENIYNLKDVLLNTHSLYIFLGSNLTWNRKLGIKVQFSFSIIDWILFFINYRCEKNHGITSHGRGNWFSPPLGGGSGCKGKYKRNL